MYLISLATEDKIPYLGITISSFVAIHVHPHWTTLCYYIGELTHTHTNTHILGDYSNPTHGGEINYHMCGCIYAFL